MKSTVTWHVLAMLLGCAWLAGCAVQTYPGPRLSRDREAILTINAIEADIGFEVLEVDGKTYNLIDDDLALLPGSHELLLKLTPVSESNEDFNTSPLEASEDEYDNSTQGRKMRIVFEAEAGHRYFLQGSMNRAIAVVQVIDRSTDRPVPTRDLDF